MGWEAPGLKKCVETERSKNHLKVEGEEGWAQLGDGGLVTMAKQPGKPFIARNPPAGNLPVG